MNKSRYLQLIAPAQKLIEAKGQDYNHLLDLHSYFPFGDKSYAQMVHVKSLRLVSLALQTESPNFESKVDTLYDNINYSVVYLDYLLSLK
jgi:hypothetical protein